MIFHLLNKLRGNSKRSQQLKTRILGIEKFEDRCMLAANMADIVLLMDESGSAAEASIQDWARALVTGDVNNNDVLESGEKSLATKLAEKGITDVRYGLVGLGEDGPLGNRYAHSQLFDHIGGDPDSLFGDPTSATSSGPDDPFVDTAALNDIFGTQPNGNLNQAGGEEDGWDALEHVIAEYEFRDGAAPVVVLVQGDEGRVDLNDTLERAGVLAALQSKNVILNSMIVGETIDFVADPLSSNWAPVFEISGFGGRIFGVDSDQADNVPDGLHDYFGYDSGAATGKFDPATDTLAGSTSAFNGTDYDTGVTETNDSYIQMAWDTAGAALDIGVIDAYTAAPVDLDGNDTPNETTDHDIRDGYLAFFTAFGDLRVDLV